MKIDFFNASEQDKYFKEEITDAVNRVLESNQFVDGPETRKFEADYAVENNVKYCATVSSGTSALEILFRALKLNNGSNILCPTNSFLATASSIITVGSNPIFCDSGDDFLLDLNKVEDHLKRGNIDAVLLVNLYGNLAPLNTLQELCIRYGVKLLIDGAQNAFAKFHGKSPAAYCIAETQSFYTTKSFGTYGEGGAILTNSQEIYDFAKSYRNHGRSSMNYYHDKIGTNARLSETQIAILNVKLSHKDFYIKQRIASASLYSKLLSDHSDILTKWNTGDNNNLIVPYVFPIRTKKRDELKDFLAKNEIPTIVHYNPIISEQYAVKYLRYTKNDFPVAFQQSQEVLSLPYYVNIPITHIQYITKKVIEFLG